MRRRSAARYGRGLGEDRSGEAVRRDIVGYRHCILALQQRAMAATQFNIGVLPGHAVHYWHGSLASSARSPWTPHASDCALLTRDGTLQLHGPEGALESAWELIPRAGDTAYSGMLLPHPAGGRIVVRCGGKLFWAQYPATVVAAAGAGETGADWVGSPVIRALSTARKTGEPIETGQPLAGGSVKLKDATVTALKLKGDALVDSVIWSADGKFCYLLAIDGTLSKLEMPKLVEQRRPILPNRAVLPHFA